MDYTFTDAETTTVINALKTAAGKFTDCAATVRAEVAAGHAGTGYARVAEQFDLQAVQARCLAERIDQTACPDFEAPNVPPGRRVRIGVTLHCGYEACQRCYRAADLGQRIAASAHR